MKLVVVGLGLIGGSVALAAKKRGYASSTIGVDLLPKHCEEAIAYGVVDEVAELEDAVAVADVVVLAIPVNAARSVAPRIVDLLPEGAVLVDMGSTKKNICDCLREHPKRGQFVAAHPIAGTEDSGPASAFETLFDHKKTIICEKELSNTEAVNCIVKLFEVLKMNILFMGAGEHDMHIAYVSHLSHITSFTLGLTVLDIEKDEKNIFNMAGSGFASTVRLAKSSPDMWAPIFETNASNISDALEAYIKKLKIFKAIIDERDADKSKELMENANDIRRILEGIELSNKS